MSRQERTADGRPTDGELTILRMLWQYGPGTARQLQNDFAAIDHPVAAATVHRFLNVMVAKGLIERDGPCRPYSYRVAVPQEQMQQKLLSDLLDRVFFGDPAALVEALLAGPLTYDHLTAIRQVLDACIQRRTDAVNAPPPAAEQQYF